MFHKASKNWQTAFSDALKDISALSQFRQRSSVRQPGGNSLDFGSNDYLGLRGHPQVQEAVRAALLEQGWGSGASPVLSGYSTWHAQLEQAIAELCDCESAVVFSSGFGCNVGSVACLADADDAIYSDSLNHASLIDGIRLSKANRVVFPHNDVVFLESHLRQNRSKFNRVLIVTESVFSMDGDLAELRSLESLAREFDCGIVVDEAHATGIYGQTGGGLLQELGLSASPALVLKLGTLSKAMGGVGGFAAGSNNALSFLVNRCRSYLFSTAPPAATMSAALAALKLLVQMSAERRQLRENSTNLRHALRQIGWSVPQGDGPIVPVIIGSEDDTLALHQRLQLAGIYVPAIRPPTVPAGSSRLRISLSVSHQRSDIEALITAFGPAEGSS